MIEPAPDPVIVEEAEERSSVRQEIRDRRAARSLHLRDRRTVFLVVPVIMLLIVGLGAMLSASSVVSIRETSSISQTGDHLFYMKRQIVWVGLGLASLVVFARIPYRVYRRFAVPIFLVAIAGLVATLVMGDVRGGARRWIELGPVTIQASEFAKLATVFLLAAVLAKKDQLLRQLPHFLLPVLLILGAVSGLLLLQPDFGTTLLIGGSAFAMLIASAAPLGFIVGLGGIGGILAVTGAFAMDYRRDRITGFLDPFADPLGTGHQAVQSLVALGSGGWLGVGLGASRARWSFLPNAHTDFIFAIIGEETGFVGASLVIVLFAVFAAVGIRIALTAPDAFGRLVAIGIIAWLTIQALVNVGGVVAVLPITGVPLPFVSSGGNAMIVNLAAVGILVNISRTRAVQSATP
ncbi:MAG: putative lipid II flippase FtsW [Actinomycetota bacterium]|nr:putative lipid II flippase FtsW [Actinomycetota bacterium]